MICGLKVLSLPQLSWLLQPGADGKAPLKKKAHSRLMYLLNGMATQNLGKPSRPSQVTDHSGSVKLCTSLKKVQFHKSLWFMRSCEVWKQVNVSLLNNF